MIPSVTQSSSCCQVIPSCLGGNSPLLNQIQSECKEIFLGLTTILSITALTVSLFTGAFFAAFCYGVFAIASMIGFRLVKQVKVLKPLEESVVLLRQNTNDQRLQIDRLKTVREELNNTNTNLTIQVDRLQIRIDQLSNVTKATARQIEILDGLLEKSAKKEKCLQRIRRRIISAQVRLEATQIQLDSSNRQLDSSNRQLDSSNRQLSVVVSNFEGLQIIIQEEIKQLIQLSKNAREIEHAHASEQKDLLDTTIENFNALLGHFEEAAERLSPPKPIYPILGGDTPSTPTERLTASDTKISYTTPQKPVVRKLFGDAVLV